MSGRLLAITFLLVVPSVLVSQSRVGDWNSYTSFLDVRQAIELDQRIACASSGGVLVFHRDTETFEMLTNIDGLVETDLSTIAVDKDGYLWLGSSSPVGIVQIYDLENRRSVDVFDFDLTQITGVATSDSAVFVAYSKNLDWGILEFTRRGEEFIYRQIYNPSPERLEYISGLTVWGDSLFAASDIGLFVGDYRRYILNYPQNWQHVQELSVSPISRVKDLGQELLIIADGEVWSYVDSFRLVSKTYAGKDVLNDVTRGADGRLYGATSSGLVRFSEPGEVTRYWTTQATPYRVLSLRDGNLLLATAHGLDIWDLDTEAIKQYVPNTPVSNVYTALTVLEDGRLVAAGREGISVKTENGWYNIVPSEDIWAIRDHDVSEFSNFVADTVQFLTSRVWSLAEAEEQLFLSLQGVFPDTNEFGDPIGGGLISINIDRPGELVVYDTTDGHLDPSNSNGYMNIRGLYVDGDENVWISNFAGGNLDKKITVLNRNGEWFFIPQSGLGGIPQKLENPTDVIVAEDNIAIAGSSKDDGLFVLRMSQDSDGDGFPDVLDQDADDDGIPNDTDADDDGDGIPDGNDFLPVEWQNFSENHGLENNTVWSLISPESRVAWILTAQGLQQLTFNSDYSTMTPYFFTYFAGVPFGEGSKIAMDSRENVWTSSVTAGVYVLLANATPWPDWNGFRHGNSPLLADEVTAIAFDNERGIAYIATSKGINSLRIPFAEKRKTYSQVTTFPSPFRIPSSVPMVIDGLMDNSSVKIMMLSGRVLRDIASTSPSVNGYQAFWDGKADSGEYVGTGVYLIAIYSETAKHVTKVAVIRD